MSTLWKTLCLCGHLKEQHGDDGKCINFVLALDAPYQLHTSVCKCKKFNPSED